MKVVVIIKSPVLGGAERVAINLAKWFCDQKGSHATIVALSGSNYNMFNLDDYDYVELNSKLPILSLRRLFKKRSPDLVLTMGVPLCVYTVPALLGMNIKHVISERNDPAHFAGKTITRIVSRYLMKYADGYVFQTKDAQLFYQKITGEQSAIIHNPLFNLPTPEVKNEYNNKLIVSVGRLVKQKNHRLLIEAFREFSKDFPDYNMTIYGEGEERNYLETLVERFHLQLKVKLPGSYENIFDEIQRASLFVLSSDYEGMPNALMEAMALGLPCISTDCPCGGPSELIENGENGVLVPVGDVYAMAEAMKKVIGDKKYAELLGKNAMLIREAHAMDLICRQWKFFFDKVLS